MIETAESLAPSFLLALPHLQDPNFRKTVVLITSHGESGAMGLVVNRVLPATVPEVLDGLEVTWNGDPTEPVWRGGPVMPQSGWVLFEAPGAVAPMDAEEVLPGVYMSASLQTLRLLGECPPRRFRLLLGYAGWSPGQLESELLEGAWTIVPADAGLLFDGEPENMWGAAFASLGIDPRTIVPGSGVQ